MTPQIVANRIMTPDGTILQSFHRHDYKTYIDRNGLEYMVDGGLDYLRRNYNETNPYSEMSVYADDDFKLIREAFHWGTRGKDGKSELVRKPLSSLTDDHISTIIETQDHVPHYIKDLFERELQWRKK
jgi:hypothetical protein